MIPLFSWRSLVVIIIGLIIGIMLGVGYWAFSPTAVVNETVQTDGGFLRSLGIGPATPTEPWKSVVKIQVVNPGSTVIPLAQLGNMGLYYAAKAKSLPFLQFLSLDLATNSPTYKHTVDELDQIISTVYDAKSEQPTIVLQVTTPTAEEALFLASRVPTVFQDFLVAEENDQQKKTRDNVIQSIDDIKKAIVEAEQEINILEAEGFSRINNDPTYIALDTKVTALESELARQATVLAAMTYEVDGDRESSRKQEYENTSQEIKLVKEDIVIAEQKLNLLEEQQVAFDPVNLPSYITLTAEITALETQINIIMNGTTDTLTGVTTTGLAEMITNGITSGTEYEAAKNKLDTASAALSNDKKQLAILEGQASDEQLKLTLNIKVAQADVDSQNAILTTLLDKLNELAAEDSAVVAQKNYERTSTTLVKARQDLAILQVNLASNLLSKDIDYQNAQAKIATLNNELTALNNRLSATFLNTGGALQEIDSLAMGNPSAPEIIFPDRVKTRNALVIGALIGMVIAWATLNRKWLRRVLASSGEKMESQ